MDTSSLLSRNISDAAFRRIKSTWRGKRGGEAEVVRDGEAEVFVDGDKVQSVVRKGDGGMG